MLSHYLEQLDAFVCVCGGALMRACSLPATKCMLACARVCVCVYVLVLASVRACLIKPLQHGLILDCLACDMPQHLPSKVLVHQASARQLGHLIESVRAFVRPLMCVCVFVYVFVYDRVHASVRVLYEPATPQQQLGFTLRLSLKRNGADEPQGLRVWGLS